MSAKRTYYRDNPNLGFEVVDTDSGQKEYKINCRKIASAFYRIHEECFPINDKWYRVKSGLIEFDNETKSWVLVSGSKLVKGILSFDPTATFGKFAPNPYNNCIYEDLNGQQHICINTDILIQSGRIEDFSTGIWYDKTHTAAKRAQTPRNIVDHTHKGYNIEDNKEEYPRKMELYKNYKVQLNKNVSQYGHMLGDTTFGLEIEAAAGNLPDNLQNRYGIVICRDGSLKDEEGRPGPEFVTVPMQGAKGLQTTNLIGGALTKRTRLNINCSLHNHFGNLPTSRMYLVSLYKLGVKLQNEMFTMFPFYKAKPDGIKANNKNYCQKLPTLSIKNMTDKVGKEEFDKYINNSYTKIFSWLSDGYVPDMSRNRKNKKHPVAAKWERHGRYYWINFMNTIFSERNTIEFRLHGPTTNSQKMINWLFICNAILKYANTHAHNIILSNSEISLKEVLKYYKQFGENGKFLSEYLNAYVEHRKEAFLADYKRGDYRSDWDFTKDSDYVFTYNNISQLF